MERMPDVAVMGLDRVIIGIDPGTNVMGYAILGVKGGKPLMIAMGVIQLGKLGDHYLTWAASSSA